MFKKPKAILKDGFFYIISINSRYSASKKKVWAIGSETGRLSHPTYSSKSIPSINSFQTS
jgi:hypothetical protein